MDIGQDFLLLQHDLCLLQRMIARNSRTKPQTAGSLISQAVASLRHWVSANDLLKIKSSGIPTLVVSSKYPVSFLLSLDDCLCFASKSVNRCLYFFLPSLLQYTDTTILCFSFSCDGLDYLQKIHGITMRI